MNKYFNKPEFNTSNLIGSSTLEWWIITTGQHQSEILLALGRLGTHSGQHPSEILLTLGDWAPIDLYSCKYRYHS